jgi:WD40 repeat protein
MSFASLDGCGGSKESLILVTVSAADYAVSGLKTLVVTCDATTQVYRFSSTISTAALTVGLYVPSGTTGRQTVTAQATAQSGQCGPGYSGTASVNIGAAGATVSTAIVMDDATTCPPGGGGGGTTGPTLANCTEIDHGAAGTCASCVSGQGDSDDVAVYGAAFSPVNPQLAVTGGGGTVKIWTNNNGTLTAQGKILMNGPGYDVVAFSPDGTLLAVGRTGGVDIVQVSDWSVQRTLTIAYDAYGVAFSPDGTEVITLDQSADSLNDGTLYVHAVGNIQALHTQSLQDNYALAVSPTSTSGSVPVAVTFVDGSVMVYSLTSSGFVSPVTLQVTSNQSLDEAVQFSPLGNVLASGGDDGLLNFWSVPVTTGAASLSPAININLDRVASTEVRSLAFSVTGAYIAVGGGGFTDGNGGGGSLSVWNAAAPRVQVGLEYDTANSYDVVSPAFSPNGNLIIAGEEDCGCVVVCPQ